jgi:hypothetical protein
MYLQSQQKQNELQQKEIEKIKYEENKQKLSAILKKTPE